MKIECDNLTASLEDYLETIYLIAQSCAVARCKEIAEALGVAKPSVTSALRTLASRGLINYKAYGYVSLTDAGTQAAKDIVSKHSIIQDFFSDVLGIEAQTAQRAACELEHSLGPAIISKLLSFVEFIHSDENGGKGILEKFKAFHISRTRNEQNQEQYGKQH